MIKATTITIVIVIVMVIEVWIISSFEAYSTYYWFIGFIIILGFKIDYLLMKISYYLVALKVYSVENVFALVKRAFIYFSELVRFF